MRRCSSVLLEPLITAAGSPGPDCSRRARNFRWISVTSLLDHLHEPERHCSCGHHEGSHCHGFSNQACMWCECRAFEDPDRETAPVANRPSDRRRFFPAR